MNESITFGEKEDKELLKKELSKVKTKFTEG